MIPKTMCSVHLECPRHVPSIIQCVFAQGLTSWAIVKFHTEADTQLAVGRLDGFHDRLGTRVKARIADPQQEPIPKQRPKAKAQQPSHPPPPHLLQEPLPKKRSKSKANVFRVATCLFIYFMFLKKKV